MLQHRVPIDNSEQLDARRPHARRFAHRHQRHVAAIRPAGDADSFRIDVARGAEELRSVHLILQIAAAEVLEVHLLEGEAIAGRSADIRCDHGVSARDEGDDIAAERVDGLSGRSTVRQDDSGIPAVALQIERHPQQRADRGAVEALVVDDLRRRQRRGVEAGDRRVRQLRGAVRSQIVNPEIRRLGRALMDHEQAVAIGAERSWTAGERIHSGGDRQFARRTAGRAGDVRIGAAILVHDVRQPLSVGREVGRPRFPLQIGKPGEFLRRHIEQRDVVEAAFLV